MKKLLLGIIVISCWFSVNAQQEAQYTQFMYNQAFYNPAFAGARGIPSVQTIFRRQWISYEGAPTSAIVSFNAPIVANKVGVGLSLSTLSLGIQRYWQAAMSYSYNINLDDDVDIRLGLSGNMKNLSMNFNDERNVLREENDPSIVENAVANTFTGNFGLGIYGMAKNVFFGVSVPNLLKNEISFNDENLIVLAEEAQHMYFLLGGIFPVNEDLKFKPSLLGKYVQNAPFDIDLNASLIFENRIIAGLSYRAGGTGAGESLDLTLLYQMKEIALGVAYDISLSDISRHTAGTFEFLFRYDFIKDKEFFIGEMGDEHQRFFF